MRSVSIVRGRETRQSRGRCYDPAMQTAMAVVCATAVLAAATGCSNSSDQNAADGAAEMPVDAPTDVPPEASGAAACTDGSVRLIPASDYDQSCTVNAECAAVGVGNACDPCTAACYNTAINYREVPRYLAAFAKAPSGSSSVTCGCPATVFSCCRDGMCHADLQCQNALAEAGVTTQTGTDAATDAGASDASIDAAADGSPADAGAE
jgi:hypothetical protein